MIRCVILLGCVLLGTVSSGFAAAQGLPDPTRPPAALEQAMPGQTGEPVASGLQTIIRRAGAKPAAVINGEYVVLGGRVGESRLVKVGEDSVILQGPTGKEELRLSPAVEIRKSAPQATKSKAARRAKGAAAPTMDEATK